MLPRNKKPGAWFGICAIAFGGRFLVLGAPVQQAAENVEQRRVDPQGQTS